MAQREDLCRRIERLLHWRDIDERELATISSLIRKASNDPPTVLDVFAGGGAIPLEASHLGCEAIAVEYNPVAWFILKCTLEFPSMLAGKTWPLPAGSDDGEGELFPRRGELGDLAAQVRYWGGWVRSRVSEELAPHFPIINDQNPVAYFWARTVPCQDPKCGATVPLLKPLWLSTKAGRERALRLKPNPETQRVEFAVFSSASKSEVESGTVANSKAFCPFHNPPLRARETITPHIRPPIHPAWRRCSSVE